jgi:hypothetical protein
VNVTIKQSDPKAAQFVSAFVSPRNWEGSESTRPIQVFSLDIKNTIDGERVVGPVSFSKDEATRKKQVCEPGFMTCTESLLMGRGSRVFHRQEPDG